MRSVKKLYPLGQGKKAGRYTSASKIYDVIGLRWVIAP